jgi:hypothetical protein
MTSSAMKMLPAVSRKELMKIVNLLEEDDLKKMKTRVERVGDIKDLKKLSEYLRKLSGMV